jgi:hypothetical protein
MSEKKTWMVKPFKDACERKNGSYIGNQQSGKKDDKWVVLAFFFGRETEKKVLECAAKVADPASADNATEHPLSVAATLQNASAGHTTSLDTQYANGTITTEEILELLRKNNIPGINVAPLSNVGPNETDHGADHSSLTDDDPLPEQADMVLLLLVFVAMVFQALVSSKAYEAHICCCPAVSFPARQQGIFWYQLRFEIC